MENKRKWLRLDLQTFAAQDEEQTKVDDTPAGAEKTDTEVDNKVPYDRFKAKVDEANSLKTQLAELQAAQEAAERTKLEEQNEFKSLYEKAQADLAALKADALNAKKDALLAKAGYTDEQVALLRGTIAGESDEELTQAIEGLKAVIAPKPTYVDPPLGNGERSKTETQDRSEIGVKAFERIKNKLF
ncbi:hypothetical protein [Sporosarcina sp. ITBMC105]